MDPLVLNPSTLWLQVLRDGVIIQAGKYHDLLQTGTEFSTLVTAHNKALDDMQMNASMNNDELGYQQDDHFRRSVSNGGSHLGDEMTRIETHEFQNGDTAPINCDEVAVMASEKLLMQQLVKDEEKGTGNVPYHVYWTYSTVVAGGAFIPVYILSQMAFQASQIFSSYWMAWGTSSAAQVSMNKLISVYSLLGASGAVFLLLKTITLSMTGLKAGQKYFTKMLRSVFRAPMSFFDSTPSGRIISRVCASLHSFSKMEIDLGRIFSFTNSTS